MQRQRQEPKTTAGAGSRRRAYTVRVFRWSWTRGGRAAGDADADARGTLTCRPSSTSTSTWWGPAARLGRLPTDSEGGRVRARRSTATAPATLSARAHTRARARRHATCARICVPLLVSSAFDYSIAQLHQSTRHHPPYPWPDLPLLSADSSSAASCKSHAMMMQLERLASDDGNRKATGSLWHVPAPRDHTRMVWPAGCCCIASP